MIADRIDMGSIKIHKKVLAEIAFNALTEIDGGSPIGHNVCSQVMGLVGMQHYPGITVSIDRNNQVSLDVRLNVRYGVSIPDIARQVQENIRQAVDKTLEITLKDINVNIHGIERRDS